MITFKAIYEKLEKLEWPPDAFISVADFQTIRYAPPSGDPIPVSSDAFGEYLWFLRTRIRPKVREIPTLSFDKGDN